MASNLRDLTRGIRRSFLRPLASLALAVALAAPVALSSEAEAQLGRRLPSPVSAAQLEQMLRDSGLPDTTKDAALPLHEAYFARFREFEKNELDPALSRPRASPFDLSQSVDAARKEADLLRRTFQRAADLDAQLVTEIEGVLPADEAWKSRKLRDALARRRCALLAPAFSTNGKPLEYSLRTAPAIATLDPDTARIVGLALEIYESELTRQSERYALAAFERIVKGAEIRDEMGIGEPPNAAGAEGENAGGDPMQQWLSRIQEAQRRADEDTRAATLRIRKLHRDGLEQIMPLMPSPEARAVRNHMMAALYPMLREKSPFDAVYEKARAMHDKGEIDESKWHTVQDLVDANELSSRPLAMDMMSLLDQRPNAGDSGMIMIGGGPLGDDAKSETGEKLERLKKSLATLESSNADTLRATIGLAPAQEADGRPERGGIDLGQLIANGGGDVQFEGAVAIGMAGAGGGDMIVLSGDDMADGGMFFGGFGGGGPRMPRAMGRDELDALAQKLGFAKDARAVFDEIAARAQEARVEAEKELKPQPSFQTMDEGGGVSISVTLSSDDGLVVSDGGDTTKLAEAIDAIEETMFDELRAAAAADKADAVESARRARARLRLLPGESGGQAVDLVAVAEGAALGEAARARIAQDLGAWDAASVDALRNMKREVQALERERDEIFKEATKVVTEDNGQGSVSTSRSLQIEGDSATRLEQIETGIRTARTRVGDGNRRTLDGMVDALSGDEAAQKALRRAYLRAANPTVYKSPRDLEPFFTKAGAIAGLTEAGKSTIAAVRAEWTEARESRCEEFCAEQDKRANTGAGLADPGAGMQQMQVRMRERKKLREDLEQMESMIFRKLQEVLIVDVGPEKAKELGELPARKRPQMPTIQIGN